MQRSLELVAQELALVEARMLEEDPRQHEVVTRAVVHLIRSGGKRIRPVTALLTCQMLGADCRLAVNLAAAVEMLHTATLVHDDIIDGSLIRRGNPTLNATWSPGATILTGDYLFARAADLASQTENVAVMRLFSQALMNICNGELQQMFATQHHAVDRESYLQRISAKTASLFVLATEAAGVLAQVSPEIRVDLHQYGAELGLAFQIVDDLLDFAGSEAQVGKPLGSDLAQGLVTLPVILFLEQSPGDQRILAVLEGQRGAAPIRLAVDAIRDSGVVDRVREEAARHSQLARQALENLPDNVCRQALIDLAEYTVHRSL
jgi:geranylgeranyl pyrophosphate synthase